MKKICWLLIITLLFGCLAACQSTGLSDNDRLTKNQKEEIDRAWEDGDGMPYGEWYDDGFPYGPRYYGTENGYIFMFVFGAMTIESGCTIGGYEFKSSESFNIYAYKDGVFSDVSDLYDQGLISDGAVKAMWDEHQRIEEELKAAKEG